MKAKPTTKSAAPEKQTAEKPAISWRTLALGGLLVALAGFALSDLWKLCTLNFAELPALHSQLDESFAGLFPLLHADEVVDFADDGDWDSGMYVSCQYAIAPVRIDYADYLAHRYTHPHVIEAFPPGSTTHSKLTVHREYQVVKKFENGITLYERK